MFLVKVLMGDSYECQSNSSLRMPPEKAPGTNTGEIQFLKIRYYTLSLSKEIRSWQRSAEANVLCV